MIEIYNYISILFIILLCAYVTWMDIKTGKIKNKIILFGILGSFILNLIFILISNIFSEYKFWGLLYYKELIINLIIAIIVSYIFWFKRLWSAGDAKLFIVIVLLLPLTFYKNGFLPYFPAFALLFNIFFSASVFYLIIMLYDLYINFSYNKLSNSIREIFIKIKKNNYRNYFVRINIFFLLFIFMSQTSKYFSTILLSFLYFLIIYYIRKFIYNIARSTFGPLVYFLTLICVLMYYLKIFSLEYTINFLPNFLIIFIIFFTVRLISEFYINRNEEIKLKVEELKPGMVLANRSIKKYKDKDTVGEIMPDGLTKEQVRCIKNSYKYEGWKYVYIYKTIPFGIWVFIGTVVTILLKENLYHFLLRL